MTSVLEFLFKYRPLVFSKGTLVFRPVWPSYVSWTLAGVAVVLGYLLYRRFGDKLPVSSKLTLAALRAAALLVFLVIFLQPTLILHSVIPQRSFVAIAYDVSKSMEIHDGPEGQTRLDAAADLLRMTSPFVEELNKKFKVRFFRFSGKADRAAGFENVGRHGSVTDLERTLGQISGELGAAPVSGIVLVTDGADNRSRNLSAAAARLRGRNVPVYAVGIGTPGLVRDTEIVRVDMPRSVLRATLLEADVSVRSSGYAGRRTKLQVKDRDVVLNTQEITLGGDGEVKTYKVNFSSDTPGPRLLTFAVEPFQDETISENNTRTAVLRVEDVQPQILYVEGEPRWTYAFLRRASEDDKNLRVVTLLRQADGKFLRQGIESPSIMEKGFPTDKSELFRYKAIILGSIEASFFTFDQLRMISDFVSQRGGGFLMLGGRNSFGQGGYVNTPIEDLLPVNLRFGAGASGIPAFQDLEYKLRLTSYGFEHPVTRMSLSQEENRKRWEAAPALVGYNPTTGPKPGATVLGSGSAPDVRGQSPAILAFQRFGRGKSMALTTASTWRWRMGLDARDNFHELFWKQMLRWLVSDVPDPVTVETEKNSYSRDEAISFRAEVNDGSFLHLNNARVNAAIKAPSGQVTTVPLTWDVSKDGQYAGLFKPQEDGIYEISTEAQQGSKTLGTAKANFWVGESTEEFHDAALNTDLLKRLTSETGGRYYSAQDARLLPQDISYVDNGASQIEEKELWDMPFLFLLLIGAVSGEWFVRKRNGLA
jgi:uncharacterized membrane protein